MTVILGIIGRSGSGKSTMADYLIRQRRMVSIAQADPLKRFAQEVYGFTNTQLWGPSEARNAPDERYPRPDGTFLTPREALQLLGTEWGRRCYEDTWVDYCMADCSRILNGEAYEPWCRFNTKWHKRIFRKRPSGIVITDIRFANEVNRVREGGAIVIKLESSWAPVLEAGVKDHASEKFDIPDSSVDHVLEVPKGLPAFYSAVDGLLQKIGDRSYGRGE